MKLIKTRLLKIISKKISKSNLCRMKSGNIFHHDVIPENAILEVMRKSFLINVESLSDF